MDCQVLNPRIFIPHGIFCVAFEINLPKDKGILYNANFVNRNRLHNNTKEFQKSKNKDNESYAQLKYH